MTRRIVTVALGIIAVIVLAFALIGVVRQFIAPFVLRTIWRVYLMSDSIPQVMIWAIFVAFIPVLAAFVLIGEFKGDVDDTGLDVHRQRGRVSDLRRMIRRSGRGPYFRRQLIRQMTELTLEMFRQNDRLTAEEAKARLRGEQSPLTPDVQAYLDQGARRLTLVEEKGPPSGLGRLLALFDDASNGSTVPDPELEALVAFLEQELEVSRER